MSGPPAEDLRSAFADALTAAAPRSPGLRLAETPAPAAAFAGLRAAFPDRCGVVEGPDGLGPWLARAAAAGQSAYVAGPVDAFVPPLYPWIRAHASTDGGAFRLIATRSGLDGATAGGPVPVLDDVTLLTTVPGFVVLEPSDGRSARAMAGWLASTTAPAYVRLTERPCPALSDAPWEVGKARTLRDGSDLAVLAVGTTVPLALGVAEELARVGVSTRVLDLASVKPLDLKAILRAARDTGALLTLEAQLVAHGLGTTVAALTAENAPVPVRRLGVPDLATGAPPDRSEAGAIGLSRERVVEEAWELLRLKGKVQ